MLSIKQYIDSITFLSCKEKGHRNSLCTCEEKQYPVNPNDFIEQMPGKSINEFLASMDNDDDRKKLTKFFADFS
jgi:hypothetical protein